MKALVQEKERAIYLRKKGYSYKEILAEVPVAKSSLSLWLAELPLTKSEKLVLKDRKNTNITRGRIKAASELRKRRLEREALWLQEARQIFQKYKDDTLFQVGLALYWAEGAKRVNQWSFSNSDEDMILVMLQWLHEYALIGPEDIFFRLYIHKPYAHENCEGWWAEKLQVTSSRFVKTIYKPTGLGVKKRPAYMGCIKIEVRRSKNLLCKMRFWQNMLVEHHLK
ncbi:hypothetical protein H6788_01380 [Candidatus Nomurabacteria bacterium]|nr:hypothetical protein [Candidatus Nomurabacteria bacterium]